MKSQLVVLVIIAICAVSAYRTNDKKIEQSRKSKNTEALAEDESYWNQNEKEDTPNIVLDEFDFGEVPDNAYGLRVRRIRIRGRRIVDNVVRRPLRTVERVARRIVVDPVVRVVRGAARLVRTRVIRFRRSSGTQVVTPTNPPTVAQCRVPTVRCPASWDLFDKEYQILDEVFIAPCKKYDLCNSCATQRQWKHEECLSRLLSDMKAMCVPYTGEENTVCHQEASKFHQLAIMGHKPVNPSPGYCVDGCVNQRGNPVVELSTN